MLFNSLAFFALLLPTLGLYWLLRSQLARLWLLLSVSLVFYGFFHWPSVFLLIFTIIFNYVMGLRLASARSRLVLTIAISVNLSLLLWFKYAPFLADNVNGVLGLMAAPWSVPRPSVFLPLGISFFTFQVIAYQMSVYRRDVDAERSFVRFAVFKCFFPQLIAGPIVRAKEFLPQLQRLIKFDAAMFHQGLWLVLAGLALKIGAADVLAQFANEAFRSPAMLSTTEAWTGLYAYAFQIYADFWGYSTMAVGLAAMFGLVLPLNFDTPYLSTSLQEFWRRWHITLSSWFRDYVYIPLGGNQRRRDFNLFITMTLAGIWHGAGWPFMLWGMGHGLWLLIERHTPTISFFTNHRVGRMLKMLLVFHGVCLLWVLFRAPNLTVAGEYFAHLLPVPFTSAKVPTVLIAWLTVFAVVQRPLAWTFREQRFIKLPLQAQWLLAVVCGYFILAYAGAKVDFIYFTF